MPQSGRFLLDINAVIALLNGEKDAVRSLSEAAEVFIPVVAAGELEFGVQNSAKREVNLRNLQDFLQGRNIVPIDSGSQNTTANSRCSCDLKEHPSPKMISGSLQ